MEQAASPLASPVLIRAATEADIPAIAEITHQAFLLYAAQIGIPSAISALKEKEADVAAALREKYVLVAESADGEILGSVRYEDLGGGIGYLSRFGVSPAAQHSGVGKCLIDAVAEGCRALGLSAIALHTGAKVSHLVQFYYRSGYYVHSTTWERGYVRALFLHELSDAPCRVELAMAK